MKQATILSIAILTLIFTTPMTFTYNKKNFSFETLDELKAKKPTISEWEDNTIFEQEFENKAKEITVTFRIIDFSKQGKIKNSNVNDDKILQIANDYVNDIKMTGQVENIELPYKTQDDWIIYSAVLKLSEDQKSSNVYYSKRIDSWTLVISIGSIKTKSEELKVLGAKIFTTLKIADK